MIKIVTDSLADLPQDIIDKFTITLISSYVIFGAETLRDRVDLQPAEFFKRLVDAKDLPTTSQASVHDFESVYRRLLEHDSNTEIISIHCTSALSGSIESGRQAARLFPGAQIHVFDTRLISMGEGLMAIEAAKMAERGAALDAILIRLAAMRDEMKSYFTLNTLDYLAKGGRIGRAARLLGTLLDTKPLLKLENGVILPDDRHHSRERAIAALIDKISAAGHNQRGIRLAIAHAVCEAEAHALAATLKDKLNPDELLIGEVGPAIGTYTGPGALGAFLWAEN